jgi:fatty acid desaturase
MRIEWPTVAMIGLCYGLWLLAGLILWPVSPILAVAVFAISAALHSSLQHEALHGHPTNEGWINELTVGILPLAPAYPFRRFKALHLRHHHDERLTDPYDDPESYYMAGREWNALSPIMRMVLKANNTLIGRLILGPPLMVWAFFVSDLKLIFSGDRKVLLAWALHIPALVLVALIVTRVFDMPLWVYGLAAGYFGMAIIALRTYCEHQFASDIDHRSIIVERSWIGWLFLNNNLHLVHHKMPTVAWYKLPAMMREKRDDWAAMNGGYVFQGYGEVFRRFAFKVKEPLLHPLYNHAAQNVNVQVPAGLDHTNPIRAGATGR